MVPTSRTSAAAWLSPYSSAASTRCCVSASVGTVARVMASKGECTVERRACAGGGRRGHESACEPRIGRARLGKQRVERGQIGVPFDERRHGAEPVQGDAV